MIIPAVDNVTASYMYKGMGDRRLMGNSRSFVWAKIKSGLCEFILRMVHSLFSVVDSPLPLSKVVSDIHAVLRSVLELVYV